VLSQTLGIPLCRAPSGAGTAESASAEQAKACRPILSTLPAGAGLPAVLGLPVSSTESMRSVGSALSHGREARCSNRPWRGVVQDRFSGVAAFCAVRAELKLSHCSW